MWELDCEESWTPKNWCFWTVVLEKTLESRLDCKEMHPVHPKGDQSWVFIGRTDAKAETPVLWPLHSKSWLIGKASDSGRDWGQEEKGMTEDEMAGWHHWLDGCELEWTPGVGDGQGGLACCDSWGAKVRNDWETELNWILPQERLNLSHQMAIKKQNFTIWRRLSCGIIWDLWFSSLCITWLLHGNGESYSTQIIGVRICILIIPPGSLCAIKFGKALFFFFFNFWSILFHK